MSDDFVTLLDDDEEDASSGIMSGGGAPWRLLIVDDDDEVHQATRFALRTATLLGRSLQIDSVYSAAEALDFLRGTPDIAVILLDVVMESEDAGLRLVGKVRDELALDEPRIILRTGQPGYAPEVEVITRYDINDYRTKSELTHNRLLVSLTSALRSYEQIHQLNRSRQGLSLIIDATNELLLHEDFHGFASSVLGHFGNFLHLQDPHALLVLTDVRTEVAPGERRAPAVIAAAGRHAELHGSDLAGIDSDPELVLLHTCMHEQRDVFSDRGFAMFCSGKQYGLCVSLQTERPLASEEQHLLRLFGQHLSVHADNIALIQHLQHIAYEDELTGLPNRASLLSQLDRALQSPAGQVLVLLDIDHFNSINESIGYEAAELLLQYFSRRLQEELSNETTVLARIGPDIFALLGAARDLSVARIESLTLADMPIGDVRVKITATGSLVPLDAAVFSREGLLSAAYAMLKEAKQLSTGHVLPYRSGLIDEVHENALLLQEMSHALAKGDFTMAYQPKWDMKQERFYGMEALLRWQKADGSWVSPAKFIPIAETSGLIVKLGQWVVQTSCKEYADLLQVNPDPGPVAINISGAQFRDEEFLGLLEHCMQEYSIRPEQMTLEITETAAINDGLDEAVARLQAIRDLGVHIALDDFGTGYSSLSYLQQLPVDQLKIDRAFVQRVHQADGRAIIGTMIELSHALNLSVVAEGAEELFEVEDLAGLDCDVLQGYVYSRPMSMPDLIKWQASPAALSLKKSD